MNHIVTSRESILKESEKLILEQGLEAVSIRSVAAACQVSVGSIYNYFSSKSALVTATIESVWQKIFHIPGEEFPFDGFSDCVEWLFQKAEQGSKQYSGFFSLHSMAFLNEEREEGKRLMKQSWAHIQQMLVIVLTKDEHVRPNAFHDQFTQVDFVALIFSFLIAAMIKEDYQSSAVLEVIKRCIYE